MTREQYIKLAILIAAGVPILLARLLAVRHPAHQKRIANVLLALALACGLPIIVVALTGHATNGFMSDYGDLLASLALVAIIMVRFGVRLRKTAPKVRPSTEIGATNSFTGARMPPRPGSSPQPARAAPRTQRSSIVPKDLDPSP